MWQPGEIEARRGVAKDLAAELPASLRIDRNIGFLMLPPDLLPDVSEVCSIGNQVADVDAGQLPGSKMFFRYRLAKEEQRTALLRIALDRRMLSMVSAYLGVLPVITEADFYASFPTQGPYTKSQLWHCDDDAGDVLKIFIYCEDVTSENGPFELVPSVPSRRAREVVGYRYAGRRYRVSDEVMDLHVPAAQQTAVLGPRGTTFVVDTVRCFHRGSRIVHPMRRRVAAMICYTPPTGITLPRRLASGSAPMLGFAPRFTSKLDHAVLGAPLASRWI
jgi:hypothetical protein